MVEKKNYRLGLIVTSQLKRTPEEDETAKLYMGHTTPGLPTKVDMRSKEQKNWTGPVRDQDGCGSCVAHSGVKVAAICRKVADNNPDKDTEMSAYDLFSHGGNCNIGWTLEAAGSAFQKYGACPRTCWDDDDIKKACCGDSKFKTLGNTRITSDALIKQWIIDHGAVQAAMDVPESFFYVDSEEVYHDDGAPIQGSHAVCLCGYDDTKGAWLLYNSWGPQWGANGFCWIGYGECNLNRGYASYGINVQAGPQPDKTGVQINTTGSLNADVIINGSVVGKTDTVIEIPAGSYVATIKKPGYYDYQTSPFTVVDKKITVLGVTLEPLPTSDLNIRTDGLLMVMPIIADKTATLMLNDIEMPIKQMKFYKFNGFAEVEAGGYELRLKDSKGKTYHNVIVSEGRNLWYVYMGKTANIHNNVFMLKLVPDTMEPEDAAFMQSCMIEATLLQLAR